MAKYSICFLDSMGLTKRSECLDLAADADALGHARQAGSVGGLVEIWKEYSLVERMDFRTAGRA